MKFQYLLLLLIFYLNSAWADFSNSYMEYHPLTFAANKPFIIDVKGEWPTDCHPGEQKPVISEYTGGTVLIVFETIVDHSTCSYVVTPYRVLVDMSDVVGTVEGSFSIVEVTVRFDGQEMVEKVGYLCILGACPPPPSRDIKPESGLYYSNDLDKQGLLLARQNQRMAAYPLIYDDAGSSEWLFGGGGIVEDVFFTELNELTGGQCLGCPVPDEPTKLDVVGKLTMLMDSEGVIQVKVNDGLFVPYEQLDFGYGAKDIGGNPPHSVADLVGRWAFVEDFYRGVPIPPTGSNIPFIPLVFDIELISVSPVIPPIVGTPPFTPPGYAVFSIRDKAGVEVTQMRCDVGRDWENPDAEIVCDLLNADFRVRMLSLGRLSFISVAPVVTGSPYPPNPIAVRID